MKALHLRRSWQRAWPGVGASTSGDATFDTLVAAYAEPHRRYHSLQHLGECLSLFETVGAMAAWPAEVEMALWFHDAVDDVKRSDNESRSADWARQALREAGATDDTAGRVHALVMVTQHSGLPADVDQQLLVDIDLAILGADAARFAEYEAQIRVEYAFVPGLIFKSKRRSILRSFLQREHIYGTAHFQAEIETRARVNLGRATGDDPAPAPALP